MPARFNRIRESWDVQETPHNDGVMLTIRVAAFDNGMIKVDGMPMNDPHAPNSEVTGWLAAVDIVTTTITLFQREHCALRKRFE